MFSLFYFYLFSNCFYQQIIVWRRTIKFLHIENGLPFAQVTERFTSKEPYNTSIVVPQDSIESVIKKLF